MSRHNCGRKPLDPEDRKSKKFDFYCKPATDRRMKRLAEAYFNSNRQQLAHNALTWYMEHLDEQLKTESESHE